MIQQLKISNFKSIKQLDIPCRKLNVFIGEPNSGKSNIIEALALQSQNAITSQELSHDLFRYKSISDLFFDFSINQPAEVDTGEKHTVLRYALRKDGIIENQFDFLPDIKSKPDSPYKLDHNGKITSNGDIGITNVRFYEFKKLSGFFSTYLPHLSVPFGENLPNLLLANAEFKKWVSEFAQNKGLRLTLKPTENDINMSKIVDNEIYSYPYFSISETMQRVIFYNMAIKSNKEAVLLFDEPDSNTFPFYTKFMGERIALDENNQFFISTHNPYLLLSLIEKSPVGNINVCLVEMKHYQTQVYVLTENQLSTVLDLNSDIFFNFNSIRS
jgi:AAA15 family ATPase/GTPase